MLTRKDGRAVGVWPFGGNKEQDLHNEEEEDKSKEKVVEGKISPPVTKAAAESVGRHLRQLARLIEEDSHKVK